MHLIRHRLRTTAADERGFAMVAVLAVMLVASIIAGAAVASSDGDIAPSTRDKERKQAYAAAEAGVNDYLARLVANVDYWRKCGEDPGNASLNYKNPNAATRNWSTVPDAPNAQYSVEVLPANGAAQCTLADPQNTYIDTDTGTFRIRATGRIRDTGDKRSIIATFKRRGFLDYVYYTDYETSAPPWLLRASQGDPVFDRVNGSYVAADVVEWGKAECIKYYRDGGQRASKVFYRKVGNNYYAFTAACQEIQFADGDQQRGPFHTNDEILVCGSPKFGRRQSDDIEVSAPDTAAGGVGSNTGWRNCGYGAPDVNDPDAPHSTTLGTWRKSSPKLEMPPSNTTLKNRALPQWRLKGPVRLQLQGTNVRFRAAAKREDGVNIPSGTVLPMPKDGVIFVANDTDAGSCTGYNPLYATSTGAGCGDLWVYGDYDYSLTLGAENDIIVDEDITHADSDDVLLGLIGNKWVRVHHPVSNFNPDSPYSSACTNNGGPGTITIEAAILAVENSFTVDRYWCGTPRLGTLNVEGAIAQKFRGPVGTSGNTGYLKNYNYDERLRFRTPPHFLDPVQASWRIQTQVEQVPAT